MDLARFALRDHAFALDSGGEGWGVAALAAGILGGIGALLSARGARRPQPATPAATQRHDVADPRFTREPEHEPVSRD